MTDYEDILANGQAIRIQNAEGKDLYPQTYAELVITDGTKDETLDVTLANLENASTKAIKAEEKRARAAEEANAKAISAEEKRATAAEDTLNSAIEAETKRAQKAEAALDDAKADKATTLDGYGIEDAYTKDEIDGMMTSAFHYKGTVDNYADLPTEGNVAGDVWNIVNADVEHGIKAGDNVAWTGTDWDVLAGIMDLSAYYTGEQVDAAILVETKRATAAEEANATAIEAEEKRAKKAEKANADAIEALEKSLGKDIEARVSAVEADLAAETKRATAAEEANAKAIVALNSDISAKIKAAEKRISANEDAIKAEEKRATAAEEANAKAIAAEEARAIAAEKALAKTLSGTLTYIVLD